VSNNTAGNMKAGYRMFGFLLVVGFAGIGVTRVEERGVIGSPGSPANAMSAIVGAPSEGEGEGAEDYSGAPDNVSQLGATSRAPGNRIRQILQDRNVPLGAARQIVSPAPPGGGGGLQGGDEQSTSPAIAEALAPIQEPAPVFASLAPTAPGTGTPVFAAELVPPNSDGGGGAGGGGGTDNGGTGGVTNPVSPVPEPSTWLYLILGLFGIGATLRSRPKQAASRPLLAR